MKNIDIDKDNIENITFDINRTILKFYIDIDINKGILENIYIGFDNVDIGINIDKDNLTNVDINIDMIRESSFDLFPN